MCAVQKTQLHQFVWRDIADELCAGLIQGIAEILEADAIVGLDGIPSAVRERLWRLMLAQAANVLMWRALGRPPGVRRLFSFRIQYGRFVSCTSRPGNTHRGLLIELEKMSEGNGSVVTES